MSLYRELGAAAQTAYAELYELTQAAEAARSPALVSGNVGYKTIRGRRYAYWAFKEIDGRKREYYLGPEGPAIAAIEAARVRGAPTLAAISRQAAASVAHGCVATPPKHFRIAKRLAEYQFFRAGALLVGTHAFIAIGNQLGIAWGSGTRTLDLDFGHSGPGGNVALALPANLKVNTGDALRSLEMGFLPALGGTKGLTSHYVSEREPELRIDFLTSMRRIDAPVIAPDLGIELSPLKFFEYLLVSPTQGVLIDRNDACIINLPDPARYGLHKLIVAAERGVRNPKHDKDILQALALIEWHLARAPDALAEAWSDLVRRGPGWLKRARSSMTFAPKQAADVVAQFKTLVKLK